VSEWLPAASVEMLSEALPFTSVTTPSEVAPSLNVTVPVGTPVAGATALTVELKVTVWPTVEGFGEEVRLVLEFPAFTVCVRTADVLAANVAFPLNAAVREWLPTARVVTLSEALPLTSVTVPSAVAPSLNVTVPVGTPAPDVTVALSVTVWPSEDGLGVLLMVVEVAAAAGALTTWFTTGDVLAPKVALPL